MTHDSWRCAHSTAPSPLTPPSTVHLGFPIAAPLSLLARRATTHRSVLVSAVVGVEGEGVRVWRMRGALEGSAVLW